jgi:hypothetical protein
MALGIAPWPGQRWRKAQMNSFVVQRVRISFDSSTDVYQVILDESEYEKQGCITIAHLASAIVEDGDDFIYTVTDEETSATSVGGVERCVLARDRIELHLTPKAQGILEADHTSLVFPLDAGGISTGELLDALSRIFDRAGVPTDRMDSSG